MDRLKINATFIGKDGSCGYKNGKRYELKFVEELDSEHLTPPRIHIECLEALDCEYQSLKAFLNNWTLIELSK